MFRGDLAIRNANIITMNPQQPQAEALVVRGGRIVAIGSWEDIEERAQGLEPLDLSGKTVVPGLIDTHAHFLWTALSLAALDVSPAEDHDKLREIVTGAVADVAPGEPVLAMGFTEYALDTAQFSPIIDVLDKAAPENPICLIGVTGHASAANTQALELMGFSKDTSGVMLDPSGSPNGLLAGDANNRAFTLFGEHYGTEDKAAELVAYAVKKAHSVGLTTIHALEGGVGGDNEGAEDLLEAMPSLPLRFVFWYQIMDVERVLGLGLPRIGGCILLDGDVGPHTAALTEPYVDEPDNCGPLYHTQEEIDAFVLEAHKAGVQIAMHAVGDAAVEQALNAYEAALEAHPREDHRHRIEHCEVISEEQVQRAEQLGVALAIQPPFNHYWHHTTYYPTLGYERAWKADPVGSLIRPGLLVAGGSDSTVTPLGPLIGVHAAVNHSNPAERISVYQALKLYTVDAARIAFEEEAKGSLEVGKLGDITVLGDDPFEIDPRRIIDIPVEKTIIGGEVVYES
jgi:predicted amidohydrolase YtcJ